MTHPAVVRARGVVGLYGDPTVSWSIGLDVTFSKPYDVQRLIDTAAALVPEHPTLGPPPDTQVIAPADGSALRQVLDAAYGDDGPLVRLRCAEDGLRLVVAAHHGAVDGLGLLALLSLLVETDVVSSATGIGDRVSRAGFVRSSLQRFREALVSPPTRLAPTTVGARPRTGQHGDVTSRRDLPPTTVDTARTLAATAVAVTVWNHRHRQRADRLVAAVGASRRDGSAAAPDRDTAYLRLRLPADPVLGDVRRALAAADPEPAFPERPPGRAVRLVTATLRNRLGSSFLVSNLGLLTVPPGVGRIAFYPTAAGPRALAVGVASTPTCTALTVRMPRRDFDEAAASEICGSITDRIVAPDPRP